MDLDSGVKSKKLQTDSFLSTFNEIFKERINFKQVQELHNSQVCLYIREKIKFTNN